MENIDWHHFVDTTNMVNANQISDDLGHQPFLLNHTHIKKGIVSDTSITHFKTD
jgi:hypothetical protein